MIEKKAAEITEVPTSSRRYPTFRFEQKRNSGRDVLKLDGHQEGIRDNEVLHGVDLLVQRGDRLAIMGPNGIGKSTLLKIAVGELEPDAGEVEWGYETHPGYFAQDHQEQFDDPTRTAEEWIWDYCPGKDIGWVRGRLALMLFSGDDAEEAPGDPLRRGGGSADLQPAGHGEPQRPGSGRAHQPPRSGVHRSPGRGPQDVQRHADLRLPRPLVREALATRIVEIKPDAIRDYPGTYEEYVHFCGDDHLDADSVILRARRRRRTGSRRRSRRGTEAGQGRSERHAQPSDPPA